MQILLLYEANIIMLIRKLQYIAASTIIRLDDYQPCGLTSLFMLIMNVFKKPM